MKIVKAAAFFVFALILVIVLNTKFGKIPPLLRFLDPFAGFWQNAEPGEINGSENLAMKGLKENVEIVFDEHLVPHIFAQNDYDAYYAQGYITAKYRLWQMDFQTRFAAGRLSEVVGPAAIELDKYQRRMGMGYGAENLMKALEKNPEMKAIINAYADGVNSYIRSLSPKNYPIEFKILDYNPELWKPINTAYLLKMMSATLAGGSDEFYMSNILKKFGKDVTTNLFPDVTFQDDPIIPKGIKWDFKPIKSPVVPAGYPLNTTDVHTAERREGIGSNNWAISGEKSASGLPILCNDPHLDLSLPSIWFQVQLHTPQMNVYGVSLPGSPCVVIGFNQDVAWGVTNTGSDVLDWYSVTFKDASQNQYKYDNKWLNVKRRIETIAVRGGKTIKDTVIYTNHGPVVYLDKQKPKQLRRAQNVPTGYALRWIAHDAPNIDVATFYYLNRAKNYEDYRKALTYYSSPAQNFAFADNKNDIAITSNGYFPIKWKEQGKFLLDGSNPVNDWQGRIPVEQNPTVKNPKRKFVSSANQVLTDQTYPYYLGWEYAPNDRAQRINRKLTVMDKATIDSMRLMQDDNYSVLAENMMPVLLSNVNRENLSASEGEAFYRVRKWNKFYNSGEIGASIFEIWQAALKLEIWKDDFDDTDLPMRFPLRARMVQLLLKEPNSKWFDNIHTPQKETMQDDIEKSFKFAVDSLERKFGPIGKSWEWGNVKSRPINHLAAMPGFGSKKILNGGSSASINAMSDNHGPSWRMVVALGKTSTGYGVYPGGQSGNPGSFYYDDMVNTWMTGKLNTLHFMQTPGEKSVKIIRTVNLKSK
ncbi:penicillin acylase family protein [Pedobacter sp. HMF7647]|uniref:Penicillin acylase family protein n=1 Tax=Hufsiella arboris TaxID=2695275 RepID=A0A7K1YEJ1_9SPHI|nr:penicillin acylase family protein [Hufsiella arboris]MXV52791.1 penicillin acylase family protein [Hufsiella arboris]